MASKRGREKTGSAHACPICEHPVVAAWRPFCSRRCADVDLGRWLTGRYVIADSAFSDDPDEA